MTDRLTGFIVTFDVPVRSDDAEALRAAILQMKGVISVAPVVADAEAHMAYARARNDLASRLWQALRADDPK